MEPQSKRPGIRAVHSVDDFVISVPDLAEAEAFYTDFGLDVRRRGGRLALHTLGHPHAWGHVMQAPGLKRLQWLSLGIYPEDEAAFVHEIDARGLTAAPHPANDAASELSNDPANDAAKGGGHWLQGPDGLAIQLRVAPKVAPSVRAMPHHPVTPPGAGAAPARSRAGLVRPRRLSHLLLFASDVPASIAFYRDVLGLRLSDHSGDGIAFLHGPHGSDHHLIALAKSNAGGLHHSSWDVGSVHQVGLGAENMKARGHDRGWGVGRHVLGSNYFYYVRDPWGSYAEYSFDIDHIPADLDWPAADHPPEDSFYVWGPTPPADFVTNFEHPAAA